LWKNGKVFGDTGKRSGYKVQGGAVHRDCAGCRPSGRLIVKQDDGTVREILSGEVSVRGLLGYT